MELEPENKQKEDDPDEALFEGSDDDNDQPINYWEEILKALEFSEVFPPEQCAAKRRTPIVEWAKQVYFIESDKPSIHDRILYWDILWCKQTNRSLSILDPLQPDREEADQISSDDGGSSSEEVSSSQKKTKRGKGRKQKKSSKEHVDEKIIEKEQSKFNAKWKELEATAFFPKMFAPREVSFTVWDESQRANEARTVEEDRVRKLKQKIGDCYNFNQSIYTFMLPYGVHFEDEVHLTRFLQSEGAKGQLYCLNGLTRLQFVPAMCSTGISVIYPWLPPDMRNLASMSTQLNTEHTIPLNIVDQFSLFRRTSSATASYIVANILRDLPQENKMSVESVRRIQWLWLDMSNEHWNTLLTWMKYYSETLTYNWFRDFPKQLVSISVLIDFSVL